MFRRSDVRRNIKKKGGAVRRRTFLSANITMWEKSVNDELHQRIRAAINDGKRAKEEAARAAAASADNAEKAVRKIQEEAAQKIEQMQKRLTVEQEAKIYQMGLNQDFKRIARERADNN